MDSVFSINKYAPSPAGIKNEIKANPKASALKFIVYMIPFIGCASKIIESGYRVTKGSEGLKNVATSNGKKELNATELTSTQLKGALRKETNNRQASDVLFVAAKIAQVIILSGPLHLLFGGGILYIISAIVLSTAMAVNAQKQHSQV